MKKKKIILPTFVVILAAFIIITIAVVDLNPPQPVKTVNKMDQFTQCLKDKKAIFYGAFWCSHCQNEKKLFGSSAHLLPYVECSTPDGNNQLEVCITAGITGYPTWVFADGSEEPGEVPLTTLAAKTGCQLP